MQTRLRTAGIWQWEDSLLLESLADREVWGIPGGGIEDNESAVTACHREFREELGIAIQCERLAFVVESFWRTDDGHARREYGFYFVVQPVKPFDARPTVRSREAHLQFRWFARAELGSLMFVPLFMVEYLRQIPTHTQFIQHSDL